MGVRESVVRGLTGLAAANGALLPPMASAAAGPSSPAVEAAHVPLGPGGLELASPWAAPSPQLTSILWADVFGIVGKDKQVITRDTAMAVPAMARARHLICGFGAKCQLVTFTGETRKATQPKWISRTGTALTPYHRMLWTLDDLLFTGWSLWDVERDRAGGPITGGASRVAAARWSFNRDTGVVLVDDKPFPEERALLIPGPHEGVLSFGRTSILQAHELEETATRVAQNPAAYLVLKYQGDVPQTTEQINEARTIWAEARRGEFGGVGYLGKFLEVQELGAAAEHLLVEGRNAAAVNMARHASLPAAMVDATSAGASLTYETTSGRNAEFLDYGADLYLSAVAARLSMDDVVPQQDSTRFDTAEVRSLAPTPTGPPTED
jgi:hypothetical protein